MAQKIEDVIKSEEKNKIEDYLYDLKVSLKMQMTKGSYSKKDIRKLKKYMIILQNCKLCIISNIMWETI